MRVTITGGGGFIGSHLVDRLLADGHKVSVLDDFSTGRHENLPVGGLDVTCMDIADADAAAVLALTRPEVVVHAAASYADPDDWRRDVRTNTLGTVHVLQGARRAGARVVYFQTALTYGTNPGPAPITLDRALAPDSSYAISKTAGERYIAHSGLDFVSFRLANVYGPRNLSGPLPAFYKRLSAGEPCWVADTRRDFVYIEDLMRAVYPAVVDGRGAGCYHVSSGGDWAIADLFEAITSAMDIEAPVAIMPRAEGDAPTILLDPSRLVREFAWRPQVPLSVGVHATVEWYREHGVASTYTHLKVPG